MNKSELVDRIARNTRLTKTSIENTLNNALEIIKKSVRKGEDVTLVGFGTFTRSDRKARAGRRPAASAGSPSSPSMPDGRSSATTASGSAGPSANDASGSLNHGLIWARPRGPPRPPRGHDLPAQGRSLGGRRPHRLPGRTTRAQVDHREVATRSGRQAQAAPQGP